jgi:hypothetical protein
VDADIAPRPFLPPDLNDGRIGGGILGPVNGAGMFTDIAAVVVSATTALSKWMMYRKDRPAVFSILQSSG